MPQQNQQKKYTRLFGVVLVILLIVSVCFVVFQMFSSSIDVFEEQGDDFVDTVLSTGPLQELEQDATTQRINILFLGISGDGYIAGHLTDSIIVASLIEQQNSESKNIPFSIPRDLWVRTNNTSGKINELYRYGEVQQLPTTQNLELQNKKYKI